jgi:hypothetical protein
MAALAAPLFFGIEMGLLDRLMRRNEDARRKRQRVDWHGLDMGKALEAHSGWIDHLKDILDGREEAPNSVANVARDDLCVLGKWLHGMGRDRFHHLQEYQDLLASHARFHAAAGLVLIEHKGGNQEQAWYVFQHEMRAWSDQVQMGVARLFSAGK